MAPMSDVNTPAFCRVLRDLGCTMIYTGLLTSHGLVRQNRRTLEFAAALPDGVEYVAQIFGADPEIMADAARILEAAGRFSAIDINMGCPVPKVVKGSAGVGLMRAPETAGRIVRAVAEAVKIPVTVKMRSGWSAEEINCVALAERCAGEGAAAVALHPRTKAQAYGGKSDWTLVARMKERLAVPVIGSGDIATPEDAARRIAETGCDAVMIGRASRGDPTLPGRAQKLLDGSQPPPPPAPAERLAIAVKHFECHIEAEGRDRGARSLRGHLAFYIKGIPGAAAVRKKIMTSADPETIIETLRECGRRYGKNELNHL